MEVVVVALQFHTIEARPRVAVCGVPLLAPTRQNANFDQMRGAETAGSEHPLPLLIGTVRLTEHRPIILRRHQDPRPALMMLVR